MSSSKTTNATFTLLEFWTGINCLTLKNWTEGPSRKVGNQLPTDAASQPKRGKTSTTPRRKPEISQRCKSNLLNNMTLAHGNSHKHSKPWNILRPQTDDHQIMGITALDSLQSDYRYIPLRPPFAYTNHQKEFVTKEVIKLLSIPILYFA